MIEDTYKTKLEKEKTGQATSEVSLDDLLDEAKHKINDEFDKDLETDDVIGDFSDAEDPDGS